MKSRVDKSVGVAMQGLFDAKEFPTEALEFENVKELAPTQIQQRKMLEDIDVKTVEPVATPEVDKAIATPTKGLTAHPFFDIQQRSSRSIGSVVATSPASKPNDDAKETPKRVIRKDSDIKPQVPKRAKKCNA